MQQLTEVLKETPASTVDEQLKSIKALHDTLEHWAGDTAAPNSTTDPPCQTPSKQNQQAPRVPAATPVRSPAPSVQRLVQEGYPRVQPISTGDIPSNHQPIPQQLCSQSVPKQLEPTAEIDQPVAHHTQYRTTHQDLRVHPGLATKRKYPSEFINLWCTPRPEEHTEIPVLDNETGESLEYCQLLQLCHHPKYKYVWNTSYSNELGRLCQGVSGNTSGSQN